MLKLFKYSVFLIGLLDLMFWILGTLNLIDFHVCIKAAGACGL